MRFSSYALTRNLGAIAAAVSIAACDAGRLTNPPELPPPAGDPVSPASIVVTPAVAEMAVGDIMRLTATALDQNGQVIPGLNIQWSTSSSNTRVTGDGTLEGVKVGDDTVFASFEGRTGKSAARVGSPKVFAVVVSLSPKTVEVGRSSQATAILYNNQGNVVHGNIYWTSSNTTVATIAEDGSITARVPGSTTIRAVSEGKNDSEVLTVVPAVSGVPATVVVSSPTPVLHIGRTAQLSAVVRDGNGDVVPQAVLTWSSSNASVGTVSSSGLATGVASGTVVFSATVAGKAGQTTLTVAPVPVNALTLALQPASLTLPVISLSMASAVAPPTSQAIATAYDADGNALDGRPVSYSSSNPSVATVSSSGTVSAMAPGSATITATSEGVSANAAVTVAAAAAVPIASIRVVLSSSSLQIGATTQALATPLDASDQPLTGRNITWSSTNTSVASVSGSGLVTAVGQGSSVIRASSEGTTGSAQVTVVAPAVLASIDISPASATLNVGESRTYSALGRNSDGSTVSVSVAWSATGGSITQQGNFTAGQIAGRFLVIATCACGVADTSALDILSPSAPPVLTAISVSPTAVTMTAGDTTQIWANGWFSNSSTPVSTPVVWSASGGSVTQTGRYIAGSAAGTFYIRAQSTIDPSKKDSTTVTLNVTAPPPPSPDPIAALTVSPQSKTLAAGEAFTFVANGWVSGSSTPVATPVLWTATGGTVDQSGNYVAGNVAGTYAVRARSTLIIWRVDSAIVTITSTSPPPPSVTAVSLSLTPASATIAVLATLQLQPAVVWSDGQSHQYSVSYTATGGSVSSGGLFTAGVVAGTFNVIATCDCGKADTSAVTVDLLAPPAPPPPVSSGNPSPQPGDVIILDTRAGGAQSIQGVSTLASAKTLIAAAGHHLTTDFDLTTNFDGTGKHAFRVMYEQRLNQDGGAVFEFGFREPVARLFVQWKQWMGRTPTGGGLGEIGAFDITNEFDNATNAGRKYLLLCRPTPENPGGCGPRVDHVWSGPSPAKPQVTISTPYNTGLDVPLSCFAPENSIGREITFTQYFQASSSSTASDGVIRIWYDGVLCAERTDLRFGPDAVNSLTFPASFRSPKFDMTEYFWDVLFWKP